DLADAPFDERLLLLRSVVVGVLREITVAARLLERLDHVRALDFFQALELVLEHLLPARGHRDLLSHGPLLLGGTPATIVRPARARASPGCHRPPPARRGSS